MSTPILVVDEDAPMRELLRELLTDEGFDVVTALRPNDVLRKIAQRPPALILLDGGCGREPGAWALLRRLKAHPATRAIPVVLCTTAPSIPPDRAAYLAAHAIAVLGKPFAIDDLLDLVAGATLRAASQVP